MLTYVCNNKTNRIKNNEKITITAMSIFTALTICGSILLGDGSQIVDKKDEITHKELKKAFREQMELKINNSKRKFTDNIIMYTEYNNNQKNHQNYSGEQLLNTKEIKIIQERLDNSTKEEKNINKRLEEIHSSYFKYLSNKINNIKDLTKIKEIFKVIIETIEKNINRQEPNDQIELLSNKLSSKIKDVKDLLDSLQSNNLYNYIDRIAEVIGIVEATMHYNKNEKFSNKINDLLNELVHNIFLNDSEINDNIEDLKNDREDSNINTMNSKEIFKERMLLEIEYYMLICLELINADKHYYEIYTTEEFASKNTEKERSKIKDKFLKYNVNPSSIKITSDNIKDLKRIEEVLHKIINEIHRNMEDIDLNCKPKNLNGKLKSLPNWPTVEIYINDFNRQLNEEFKRTFNNININKLMDFIENEVMKIIGFIIKYKEEYNISSNKEFQSNIKNLINELSDIMFD